MICRCHFPLLLCCLLVACALLLQAEAEPQPSAHPNSKNLENPLAENWNQAAGGHLSDLLFKLRRRRRDTAAVAEEIQKCIQNQMAVTDNSGVPPSTPPPSEDDYSKCDMVVDCCQIINTDHEESDRVDCDCKKLLKN